MPAVHGRPCPCKQGCWLTARCLPPRPACPAFLPYLEGQMAELNATTLQQEVDLLEKLIAL